MTINEAAKESGNVASSLTTHGISGEVPAIGAAPVHAKHSATSEMCHNIAMVAAIVTAAAILLPHLLRFAESKGLM